MDKKKNSKQASGNTRMRALGKKNIMLCVSPDVHATLRQAAELEMRPVTQFVTFHALRAADDVIAQEAAKNREIITSEEGTE